MFIESLYEGLLRILLRVCENEQLPKLYPNYRPSGIIFNLINFAILFAEMGLIMFLYAMIRPRFKTRAGTVFCASGIFWFAAHLNFANNLNLGVFPLQVFWPEILIGVVELPLSALAASRIIK